MKPPTYRDLLNKLVTMGDRLDDTITVYNCAVDEFFPAKNIFFSDEKINDTLDHNHLYITIN